MLRMKKSNKWKKSLFLSGFQNESPHILSCSSEYWVVSDQSSCQLLPMCKRKLPTDSQKTHRSMQWKVKVYVNWGFSHSGAAEVTKRRNTTLLILLSVVHLETRGGFLSSLQCSHVSRCQWPIYVWLSEVSVGNQSKDAIQLPKPAFNNKPKPNGII